MKTLGLIILIVILFSGCVTLDDQLLLIDDANYFTDLNVSDANFTDLNDTPANYTGSATLCAIVNADENGLIFGVCGGSSTDTTLDTNTTARNLFLQRALFFSNDINFLRINTFDLNLGSGIIQSNGLFFALTDLNYSVRSECSGDLNSVLNSAGDCIDITGFSSGGITLGELYAIFPTNPIGDANINSNITVDWNGLQNYPSACSAGDYVHTVGDTLTCDTPNYTVDTTIPDSNVWTENFLDNNNALVNDFNGNNNSIINVLDFNGTNLYIKTPDLNFFVYGTTIIMQTANGMVSFFPDLNKFCAGNDPNVIGCMWVEDNNVLIGFNP